MKIGVFGGSFDPVHLGHLMIAETCRDQLQLDLVHVIPANISPLKLDRQPASDHDRLEMLRLAVGGHENFQVDSRELDRGGISYTIDTLRQLQSENPNAELFLVIGADSLNQLSLWKEPESILRIAHPIVVRRGGHAEPDWSVLERYMPPERVQIAKQSEVMMPVIEISSSDLRARVAGGKSIRYMTQRAVEMYIRQHGLYSAS